MRRNLDWLESHQEYLLFKCVWGSYAHGTNIETSDKDIRGVFILPIDDILSNQYTDQVGAMTGEPDINGDVNDIMYFEIKKFLELLEGNDPMSLEMLYMPDECLIYKHPLFDKIMNNRDKFITKKCLNTFGGHSRYDISCDIELKYLMYYKRLLEMSHEIVDGKGVIVRRPDASNLILIRRGLDPLFSVEDTIKWMKSEIGLVDNLFRNSNLPEYVEEEFILEILIFIRKNFYCINDDIFII